MKKNTIKPSQQQQLLNQLSKLQDDLYQQAAGHPQLQAEIRHIQGQQNLFAKEASHDKDKPQQTINTPSVRSPKK